MKSINILINFLNPKMFLTILKKIFIMFFDKKPLLTNENNLQFIKKNSISSKKFIKKISNNKLLKESFEETNKIIKESDDITKNYDIEFGGNYALELIYFITRMLKPQNVLETGVAAGYSSYTILKALKKNKGGRLYSSDFPYFRVKNPQKYIGLVVPNKLKKDWNLKILGDEKNIQYFKKKVKSFDLIFYDSDKRYISKIRFFKKIKTHINKKTIIIIDDLHNDSFFYEYIKKNKKKNWYIVKSARNHIVGIIYPD